MKKIAIVLVIALMAVVLLCGCDTGGIFSPLVNAKSIASDKIYVQTIDEEAEKEVLPCTIRVMSYNMRCKTSNKNEQDVWENRRDTAIARIKNNNPDLLGTQELQIEQKAWVIEQLGDTYSCIGVARDTLLGVEMGEGSYIFYKTALFDVLDSGTEWLSETPNVRSYGWDAYCRRVVSYATLRHKESGQTLTYYNTHLDHKGKNAIKNGNAQILAHIENENLPCIYTGDLNFNEKNANYSVITAQLNDSKYVAQTSCGGVTYTAYNMKVFNDINAGLAIDHCFVTKDIFVKSYKVDNELINDMFGSDHFPIVIDMVLGYQNK